MYILKKKKKTTTQKQNPQTGGKEQSFLTLWDTRGTVSYRNIASTRQNVLINIALCFPSQKGYRVKHFKLYSNINLLHNETIYSKSYCIVNCRK